MSKLLDPEVRAAREVWRQEERKKQKDAAIAAAKRLKTQGDGVYTGPNSAEEAQTQSDWEKLAAIARVKFPPHFAEKFDLSPNQRLAAIAWSMGWNQDKIAKASGVHQSTISRWVTDSAPFNEFVRAFGYHTGSEDAKAALDKEVYAALQTMISLRDDTSISAATRADAAKWIWEQKYGKAKESKEIKAVNLRELQETIRSAGITKESVLDELEKLT